MEIRASAEIYTFKTHFFATRKINVKKYLHVVILIHFINDIYMRLIIIKGILKNPMFLRSDGPAL